MSALAGPVLLDHHAELIAASAIAPDVAGERGYYSATVKARLGELGFGASQRRVPALVIPVVGTDGRVVGHQIRPDDPRSNGSGKPVKYETPRGWRMRLDVHPRSRVMLANPKLPLIITEGVRKGDAAVSHGLCAVALLGVWNWRGTNGDGGKVALPDWDDVALNGRASYVAFDSDAMEKPEVFGALDRFSAWLPTRDADVRFIYLPRLHGGAKCGVDDFFAAGHSVDEFFALATDTPRRPPKAKPAPKFGGPIPATAKLLDTVRAFLRDYVVLGDAEADATALWIAHTYAFDAAYATPYLLVVAPTKKTGKTRLLEVLDVLAARPWAAIAPSEAALFRKIAQDRPTLLLDEIDGIFGSPSERTESLRAILNAGNRPGASVPRCVGEDQRVVDFTVYCPKALAGIDTGRLPDTITDRAIRVALKRKTNAETVTRFRRRRAEATAAPLRAALAAWAHATVARLAGADPSLPDELDDRAADAWEPLFAIADDAGGAWPERARTAARKLSGGGAKSDDGAGIRLLAALRDAFAGADTDQLTTAAILSKLNADDHEAGFARWNDGAGINARDVARVLSPFGVSPQVIRVGDSTPRGYRRADLADAWSRYLPNRPQQRSSPSGSVQSATTATSVAQSQESAISEAQQTSDVADRTKTANPHSRANVADVADGNRENRSEEVGDDPHGRLFNGQRSEHRPEDFAGWQPHEVAGDGEDDEERERYP